MSIVRRLAAPLLLALALAAPACKGKGEAARDRGKVVAPTDVTVAVFVDDRPITTSAMLGSEPRPLTEAVAGLPPIDSWLALVAMDSAGKVTTTMAPAKNLPGKLPTLAADTVGVELAFRAAGGKGPLVDPVHAITRLTIKTRSDAGQIAAQVVAGNVDQHGSGDSAGNREHADEARPAPTADLKIDVTGINGTSVITGAQLAALPVARAPSGDTMTPGWSLLDVFAAAGIAHPQVVHLTDGEGATLQLGGDDFDPAKTVLYLKLNRSGIIRFRLFRKVGDTWEVGGELRGITTINVVK